MKKLKDLQSFLDYYLPGHDLDNVGKSPQNIDTISKLKLLPKEMSKICPLFYNIVEVLLTEADGSIHEGVHVKSAFYALSILLGLQS